MNILFKIILGTFLISCAIANAQKLNKPNIIYILADDLGYGDLSCYGQQHFETPNIDKLASIGIKFTQHYSGSTVCAPSRSTLMTGLHTGHTPIRGNREADNKEEGQLPLPSNTITIAEILKEAGYVTGMFGKWGLGFGEGDPNLQGFDEFYGYNCQRLAHRYYPPYLNHNQQQVSLEGNDWTNTITYAPDKIQEATLNFIEKNKEKPFFAYIPFVLPHAELISPKDSIYEKFLGKFKEVPFSIESGNYSSDYGPDIIPQKYCSQETPKAVFATMIYRLDVYVGQIVGKLKELGIADNTIIMFASDNGPHVEGGADPKFFNSSGGLKGVKRDLYEGGIRSPFIVSWPNKIKKASVSNHVSAFWDVMPTIAEISGAKLPNNLDGISFLPTILNTKNQQNHEYLYWEYNSSNGRKAIRKGDWKGVYYNINDSKKQKFELYNLANDSAEKNDLAAAHTEIVAEFKVLMQKSHTPSELFPFE